jgi:predicted  nucleic acid-binding Zn-ribbon protein
MIDSWTKTTQITNELSISTKEKFEKLSSRVTELEKRSHDYALKTDLEKAQNEIKTIQEQVAGLQKGMQDQKKWVTNELANIAK